MPEPMLKSSQLWSIKSSFQQLLKFCMWIKNCCCCRRVGSLLMLQCRDAMWFYWKSSRTEGNINHDAGRKQHEFQHFWVFWVFYLKNHEQDLGVRMGYFQCLHFTALFYKRAGIVPSKYYLKSHNLLLSPSLFHFLPCCIDGRCCPEQGFLPAATPGRKFTTVQLLPQVIHICSLLFRK